MVAGRLQKVYQAPFAPPLDNIPPPRYDLVEPQFAVPVVTEATRGCRYEPSLSSVHKRQNKVHEYKELFTKLKKRGILSFTGLMLGLALLFLEEHFPALAEADARSVIPREHPGPAVPFLFNLGDLFQAVGLPARPCPEKGLSDESPGENAGRIASSGRNPRARPLKFEQAFADERADK
jgi:hypothetical protein